MYMLITRLVLSIALLCGASTSVFASSWGEGDKEAFFTGNTPTERHLNSDLLYANEVAKESGNDELKEQLSESSSHALLSCGINTLLYTGAAKANGIRRSLWKLAAAFGIFVGTAEVYSELVGMDEEDQPSESTVEYFVNIASAPAKRCFGALMVHSRYYREMKSRRLLDEPVHYDEFSGIHGLEGAGEVTVSQ